MKILFDGTTFDQVKTGYYNFSLTLLKNILRVNYHDIKILIFTTRKGEKELNNALSSEELKSIDIKKNFFIHFKPLYIITFLFSKINYFFLTPTVVILICLTFIFRDTIFYVISLVIIGLYFLVFVDDVIRVILKKLTKRNRVTFLYHLLDKIENYLRKPKKSTKEGKIYELIIWRGKYKFQESIKIGCLLDLTPFLFPSFHTDANVSEFKRYCNYLQKNKSLIMTISKSSLQDIILCTGIKEDKIFINPLDTHEAFKNPKYHVNVINKYNLPGRYILSVATLEPRKNLICLIQAFKILKRITNYNDLQLVLVGPLGWGQTYISQIYTENIHKDIIITGYIPLSDLPSLYHYSSAFIYPSFYEGFGLPVLEAMYCSSIVLCSKTSSLPEILGNEGVYFNPFDINDICEKIHYALQLPKKQKEKYRKYCRNRAEIFNGSKKTYEFLHWVEEKVTEEILSRDIDMRRQSIL